MRNRGGEGGQRIVGIGAMIVEMEMESGDGGAGRRGRWGEEEEGMREGR